MGPGEVEHLGLAGSRGAAAAQLIGGMSGHQSGYLVLIRVVSQSCGGHVVLGARNGACWWGLGLCPVLTLAPRGGSPCV